jgi:hypothetical protein
MGIIFSARCALKFSIVTILLCQRPKTNPYTEFKQLLILYCSLLSGQMGSIGPAFQIGINYINPFTLML